jgi:hypothetical protein
MLPVIAAMMRPVRQTIVIADQVTMKFNRLLDATASFPTILSEPGLNAELALDQVLPGMAFVIHLVTYALRWTLTQWTPVDNLK